MYLSDAFAAANGTVSKRIPSFSHSLDLHGRAETTQRRRYRKLASEIRDVRAM